MMVGLVRSTFQKVQRIHELEFLYASSMISLRYRLCVLYTDYASKKITQRSCVTLILCLHIHSCSDDVMVCSFYYASMSKHCHLTAIISN